MNIFPDMEVNGGENNNGADTNTSPDSEQNQGNGSTDGESGAIFDDNMPFPLLDNNQN